MMTTIYLHQSDKPAVDRLRGRARRKGLRIEKSRQQIHANNRGGLQLAGGNIVIAGADFDLDLLQAAYWIENTEAAN